MHSFSLDMFVLNEYKSYGKSVAGSFWLLSIGVCFCCGTAVAADDLSNADIVNQGSEQTLEQAGGASNPTGESRSSKPAGGLAPAPTSPSDAVSSSRRGEEHGDESVSSAATSSAYDDKLSQLENKLFQHNYAKDSTDDRLNRLEKLIFGENQNGTIDNRVSALVKAVPNLESGAPPISENTPTSNGTKEAGTMQDGQMQAGGASPAPTNPTGTSKADAEDVEDQSKYPAVTAMETKLLGKDYASEPIKDRLARLEKKVLGKASTSDDLSDRVDRLKQATGIDLARKPGSPSDWIEEDQDESMMREPLGSITDMTGNNNFGNRDIYQDMQKSANIPSNPSGYPFASPYLPDQPTKSPPVTIKSFGLSQQVSALEHEVFHKTYEHDPLPARLNRLETTVFPDQKPAVDKPLPDRVQNLLAQVPISQKELRDLAIANGIDPGSNLNNSDNLGNTASSVNKQHSGIGKLMNSLGNMLGGSGMTGGYPMAGGNFVLDQRTGMLINPATGAMINPNTGAVINPGNGTVYGAQPYVPAYPSYGTTPFGGMSGFGMSPFGSPYGMGMGSGFGFGGGGMGMGFGFR